MTQPMYRCPAVPSNQREPTVCTAEQDAPVVLSGDSSQRPSSPPRSGRRHSCSHRHRHQSKVAAANICLDRDPYRVVAVQPDPKPLRPSGSM